MNQVRLGIVEDEKLLLEDLTSNVDWHALGVQVVFCERNGSHALRRLSRDAVDIILTDIRMPVMDGIQLAQKAKQLYPDIQIIFLTSYDDASFMHSAISLDAVEYLSKPYRMNELQISIKKAVQRCQALHNAKIGQRLMQEEKLVRIALGLEDGSAEFEGAWKLYHLQICRFFSLYRSNSASGIKQMIEETKSAIYDFLSCRCKQCYVLHMSKGQFILLTDESCDLQEMTDADEAELDESMGSRFDFRILTLQSNPTIEISCLANCYRQLVAQREDAFYQYSNFKLKEENKETLFRCKRRVLQNVDDPRRLQESINVWFAKVNAEKPSRDAVLTDCAEICKSIIDARMSTGNTSFTTDIREMLHMIEEQQDLSCLEEYLLTVAAGNWMEDKVDIPQEEETINSIKRYIQKNYNKPISAETLSPLFYLASNTIRVLFKKHVGTTIHEYLTKIRMHQATNLLADPALRIKEISNMVGYDNVSYFCMRFARVYEMTPRTYRIQVLQRRMNGGTIGESMEKSEED